MGDLMFYLRNPRVDRAAGASIKNWIVTLESVAKEHPADTIYIAGHSKVNLPLNVTRADLLKFRDYFSGLLAYVQKGHRVGPPAAEIVKVASVPGFADYEGSPEGTIQAAYDELTSKGMKISRRSAARPQHRCRSGTGSGTATSRARGDAFRKRSADPAGARACRPRATTAKAPPTWQTIGAREPVIASLATRESIRALIAAGDIEPASERSQRAWHRGAFRSPPPRRRCVPRRRAVRLRDVPVSHAHGRPRADRPLPTRPPSASRARSSRQASRAKRSRPIASFNSRSERLAAFETADSGARRLSSQLDGAAPLTEGDFDSIVDRLAGVAAFRRAVDMQAEWLKTFPRYAAPRRNRVGHGAASLFAARQRRGAPSSARTS